MGISRSRRLGWSLIGALLGLTLAAPVHAAPPVRRARNAEEAPSVAQGRGAPGAEADAVDAEAQAWLDELDARELQAIADAAVRRVIKSPAPKDAALDVPARPEYDRKPASDLAPAPEPKIATDLDASLGARVPTEDFENGRNVTLEPPDDESRAALDTPVEAIEESTAVVPSGDSALELALTTPIEEPAATPLDEPATAVPAKGVAIIDEAPEPEAPEPEAPEAIPSAVADTTTGGGTSDVERDTESDAENESESADDAQSTGPAQLPPTGHLVAGPRPGADCKVPTREMSVRRLRGRQVADEATLSLHPCDGRATAQRLLSRLARPEPETPLAEDEALFLLHPELMDRLYALAERWPDKRIEIVSGYRPHARSSSRHYHGRALDLRVDGVPREEVVAFARTLDETGVGFYPNSTFTHVDVRDASAYWVDRSGPGQAPRYRPSDNEPEEIGIAARITTGMVKELLQAEGLDDRFKALAPPAITHTEDAATAPTAGAEALQGDAMPSSEASETAEASVSAPE